MLRYDIYWDTELGKEVVMRVRGLVGADGYEGERDGTTCLGGEQRFH